MSRLRSHAPGTGADSMAVTAAVILGREVCDGPRAQPAVAEAPVGEIAVQRAGPLIPEDPVCEFRVDTETFDQSCERQRRQREIAGDYRRGAACARCQDIRLNQRTLAVFLVATGCGTEKSCFK